MREVVQKSPAATRYPSCVRGARPSRPARRLQHQGDVHRRATRDDRIALVADETQLAVVLDPRLHGVAVACDDLRRIVGDRETSTNPGSSVRPLRSISSVFGPLSFKTTALDPTATIFPPRSATALARIALSSLPERYPGTLAGLRTVMFTFLWNLIRNRS